MPRGSPASPVEQREGHSQGLAQGAPAMSVRGIFSASIIPPQSKATWPSCPYMRCKRPFWSLSMPAPGRQSVTRMHRCISETCLALLDVKLVFPSGREAAALPPTRGCPPLVLWARSCEKMKTHLPRVAGSGGLGLHARHRGKRGSASGQGWRETRRWVKAALAGSSVRSDTHAAGNHTSPRDSPSHCY